MAKTPIGFMKECVVKRPRLRAKEMNQSSYEHKHVIELM